MFNPLVENLTDLSDEKLLEKVNEIQQKLGQAASAGMFTSVSQMSIILNEYQAEMNNRYLRKIEEHKETYDDLIDVNKNA